MSCEEAEQATVKIEDTELPKASRQDPTPSASTSDSKSAPETSIIREEKTEAMKQEIGTKNEEKPKTEEIKYFRCRECDLRERYEYFGNDPPFVKQYKLLENAYVIEDPFVPPKQGEFIVLGAHCMVCTEAVCKDVNCSVYYEGTYCVKCAKNCKTRFPQSLQDKLNKII